MVRRAVCHVLGPLSAPRLRKLIRAYDFVTGTSPVTGFDVPSNEFLEEMRRSNVTVTTCDLAFEGISSTNGSRVGLI